MVAGNTNQSAQFKADVGYTKRPKSPAPVPKKKKRKVPPKR